MNPKLELQSLLNGGLPLANVGPRLRYAARRAVLAGDVQRMQVVAKIIISELLRRGDLLRLAVGPDAPNGSALCLVKSSSQLLDLSSTGWELSTLPLAAPNPKPRKIHAEPNLARAERALGRFDFNNILEAMMGAQQLKVGDPSSSEIGVILESILDLLERLTPQFGLHIVLFEEMGLKEDQNRVSLLSPDSNHPSWLGRRANGQSSFMPTTDSLPSNLIADNGGEFEYSSAVAVPLYAPPGIEIDFNEDREAGLLFLFARENWSSDSALRLGAKLSRFITHRWGVHHELNQKIHVDFLTGLFNRRFFDGHFPLLLERAKRKQAPLSLILADIDHFKTINTEFGYVVGDEVLQMVARRLQEEVRKVDLVCRRGGEEFLIVLPETDLNAAREVVNRLLNADFHLELDPGAQDDEAQDHGAQDHEAPITQINITLSLGITIFPHNGTHHEQLHNQAETLMWLSKDKGRHRAHIFRNNGHHLELRPK